MFVKDTSKYWYKPNISREEGKILSEFEKLAMHLIEFIVNKINCKTKVTL